MTPPRPFTYNYPTTWTPSFRLPPGSLEEGRSTRGLEALDLSTIVGPSRNPTFGQKHSLFNRVRGRPSPPEIREEDPITGDGDSQGSRKPPDSRNERRCNPLDFTLLRNTQDTLDLPRISLGTPSPSMFHRREPLMGENLSLGQMAGLFLAKTVILSVVDACKTSQVSAAQAKAEQKAREEKRAREEAELEAKNEKRLRKLGIPPNPDIDKDMHLQAMARIGYRPGAGNIALVGNRGVGKSSMINSLRGLRPRDPGAATVGEVQTTEARAQYPDPRHNIVWYDLPGAGTEKFTAWTYYLDQKLYAFDLIVLVHNNTLTESDLNILAVCHFRNQPYVVIRSQADMHIRNKADDQGITVAEARRRYIDEVHQEKKEVTVRDLDEAGPELSVSLDDFIVSKMGILQLVTGSAPPGDECAQVVEDEAFLRRLRLIPPRGA